MLKVIARNYPDLSHLEEIMSLYRELVTLSREQPGCVSYGLYQDADHPELLTMIEEWESREALENHLHSEGFLRIVPKLGSLMTRESEMNICQQVI